MSTSSLLDAVLGALTAVIGPAAAGAEPPPRQADLHPGRVAAPDASRLSVTGGRTHDRPHHPPRGAETERAFSVEGAFSVGHDLPGGDALVRWRGTTGAGALDLGIAWDPGAWPHAAADPLRDLAAYAATELAPVAWLRVRPGLRVDRVGSANEDLDAAATTTLVSASPRLAIEAHASEQLTYFLNLGSGSPAHAGRAVVDDRGELVHAGGAEGGVRMRPHANARVSADLWYVHVSRAPVSREAAGSEKARRFGLEVEASVEVTRWLALDANLTWARSTFVAGDGGTLGRAPAWLGSGGVAVHDRQHSIALRARGTAGGRDGEDRAQRCLLFEVVAGTQLGDLELELTIENLLDAGWDGAQLADEPRVLPAGDALAQLQLTPGMPRTATVQAAYRF